MSVGVLCSCLYNVLCPFTFCNHLDEDERDVCFALDVLLMSFGFTCSVNLSHGAMVWLAVYDCGISRSYSLTFYTESLCLL